MSKHTNDSEDHELAALASSEAEVTPAHEATTEPETVPGLSSRELAELREAAAKANEHWDRYLRATADLDNFRKRATRERQEAARYANESLLGKLIPILDSFDMALTATENGDQEALAAVRQGVQMIRGQFASVLTEAGLEEIDAAGQVFDPNLHEAVSTVESEEIAEGHVVEQLRKGYRLHDRLLRPATVVVARAPAANDA